MAPPGPPTHLELRISRMRNRRGLSGSARSEAGGGGRLGQREMAITQGKMPFVFGMVVLANLLIAARDRPAD